MRQHKYTLLLAIPLISAAIASAQDSTSSHALFSNGLTFSGGIGYIAVRDEYISGEKYTGTIPMYGATWSKYHETYDFRLHMEYQHTHDLKNYGVSAMLTQFRMELDYLYPLSEANLFERKLSITLGPTAELFNHNRRSNIANSENLQSNLAMVSGGIRSEAAFPWTPGVQIRAAVQLTLISLVFHSSNANASDASPSKLLTPFAGVDAKGEIGIFYSLTSSLYASAGYRFDVTRVTAWDFFISANDNLLISLSYGF